MKKPPLAASGITDRRNQTYVGATSKGTEPTALSARLILRRAACGRAHYSADLWKSKEAPVRTPLSLTGRGRRGLGRRRARRLCRRRRRDRGRRSLRTRAQAVHRQHVAVLEVRLERVPRHRDQHPRLLLRVSAVTELNLLTARRRRGRRRPGRRGRGRERGRGDRGSAVLPVALAGGLALVGSRTGDRDRDDKARDEEREQGDLELHAAELLRLGGFTPLLSALRRVRRNP